MKKLLSLVLCLTFVLSLAVTTNAEPTQTYTRKISLINGRPNIGISSDGKYDFADGEYEINSYGYTIENGYPDPETMGGGLHYIYFPKSVDFLKVEIDTDEDYELIEEAKSKLQSSIGGLSTSGKKIGFTFSVGSSYTADKMVDMFVESLYLYNEEADSIILGEKSVFEEDYVSGKATAATPTDKYLYTVEFELPDDYTLEDITGAKLSFVLSLDESFKDADSDSGYHLGVELSEFYIAAEYDSPFEYPIEYDVNLDGKINAEDVYAVKYYLANKHLVDDITALDVNHDGSFDTGDMMSIKKVLGN
jgi:hypothetical protein